MHPRLIHPIPVIVEQRDLASPGVMNHDAREPVKQASRAVAVELRAQVQWGEKDDPNPEEGGPRETSRGYLIFLRRDLAAAGVTLKRGDRVTSVGGLDVDLYLNGSEPCMHYHTGPQGELWQFRDRQPTRR